MDTSTSARREYLRMKEEQAINNRVGTATCLAFNEEGGNSNTKIVQSMFGFDDVIKKQTTAPEVMSFPFNEKTGTDPNIQEKKEQNGPVKTSHGAKLTMLSAIVHMKCMARRKAKLIQSQNLSDSNGDVVDDEIEEDPWINLRKCRYLRGADDDKELSIDEIFH